MICASRLECTCLLGFIYSGVAVGFASNHGGVTMRWTTRGMLLFLAAASVALALREQPLPIIGGALATIIALSACVLPTDDWRRLAYGSLAGVVVGLLLMGLYARTQFGIDGPSTYQEWDIWHTMDCYAFLVGAPAGATVAFLSRPPATSSHVLPDELEQPKQERT